MRVLIIAAHPDDELLGAGATTHKLRREGHAVESLIIGDGRGSQYDNSMDELPLIAWVKEIEQQLEKRRPDRIYTHSRVDLNIDHRIIHQAVLTAMRPCASAVGEIYAFEAASSSDWNFGVQFSPSVFESLTPEDLDWKINQLYALYADEMRPFPHPRSDKYLRARALTWGATAGAPLAEAFEIVRIIR